MLLMLIPGIFSLVKFISFVFIPGILLTQLLFPRERFTWKVAISLCLGIVLIGWSILITNFIGLDVTVPNVSIVLAVISMIELLLLWQARSIGFQLRSYVSRIKAARIGDLFAVIIFFIFFMIIITGLPIAQSYNEKGFSEFYIEEGYEETPPWRETYRTSDIVTLNVIVKSNEKKEEAFRVGAALDGQTIQTIDLGVLKSGQERKLSLKILPTGKSSMERYDLTLFKGISEEPYRSLHFWIHLRNKSTRFE